MRWPHEYPLFSSIDNDDEPGGPAFSGTVRPFLSRFTTQNQEETNRYWNAIVGNGRKERVRWVQGPLGPLWQYACLLGCIRGMISVTENNHEQTL